MKNLTISFLLLICTNYCFSQPKQSSDSLFTQTVARIGTDLKADNLHGSISIAVAKNGRLIWSKAFGYKSYNEDIPADSATIYRIGSITKTFTAVLLMQLVQQGKINVDDEVEKFLPEIRSLKGYEKFSKITFKQLATHTSGLNREPDIRGLNKGPIESWQQKVLSAIPKTSYHSEPGKEFYYSNIGYAILGVALSRVADMPYMQMVQQYIFDPLHMDHTFFILPENQYIHLAKGVGNDDAKIDTLLPLKELTGRGYKVPNGGIFSTPDDLTKFAAMLIGYPPLMNPAMRQVMQTPPAGSGYAYGLITFKSPNFDTIGHDGSIAGYTAMMTVDKKTGYSVVIMRNYNEGKTNFGEITFKLLGDLNKLNTNHN